MKKALIIIFANLAVMLFVFNTGFAITMTVDGKANIFGAGHATPPAPMGGSGGVLPPAYTFTPQANQVLTFSSITGLVTCNNDNPATTSWNGAEGWISLTDILSYGGIAGVISDRRLFLVGVFLNNNEPSDPAPTRLDFRQTALTESFTELYPDLNQTFFIGDGLTGVGTGVPQRFHVPVTATRLFLGFEDGYDFNGLPALYVDNAGTLTATFDISITTPPVTTTTTTTPINDGLIAYYPFNGNANDESGNNINGTVYGAGLTTDRFGNADSSYNFDGVNSNIIDLPKSPIRTLLNGVNAFSATAWVYNKGPGDPYRNVLRICDVGPDSRGLMVRIGASNFSDSTHNRLEVLLGTTLYQTQHIATLTDIPINTWTHLAIVYDSSKIWIYINGIAPASVERIGIPSGDEVIPNGVPQTGAVTMGDSSAYISAYNTENFNGKIDEVRLYNRVLSGAEIQELYQQGNATTSTSILPTFIELSHFTTTPSSRAIILTWSTESEIDNAGFNLYRAEMENSNYSKINSSLIPAQGSSTQGASYEFTDSGVQNRKTYYYKLEDIDLNGISTMHGPESAMPRWIYGAGK